MDAVEPLNVVDLEEHLRAADQWLDRHWLLSLGKEYGAAPSIERSDIDSVIESLIPPPFFYSLHPNQLTPFSDQEVRLSLLVLTHASNANYLPLQFRFIYPSLLAPLEEPADEEAEEGVPAPMDDGSREFAIDCLRRLAVGPANQLSKSDANKALRALANDSSILKEVELSDQVRFIFGARYFQVTLRVL